MNTHEQELKRLLTNQAYHPHKHLDVLERRKLLAQSYAETENGIAVLSDFQENISYIYSGKFGEQIGLSKPFLQADSAFEEEVFSCIPPEELLERHILELRFFHFQKALPVKERPYYKWCVLSISAYPAKAISLSCTALTIWKASPKAAFG